MWHWLRALRPLRRPSEKKLRRVDSNILLFGVKEKVTNYNQILIQTRGFYAFLATCPRAEPPSQSETEVIHTLQALAGNECVPGVNNQTA
jgi:hypothetical protein